MPTLPGRSCAAISWRWENHLRPGIQKGGPWTLDEDLELCRLQSQLGNKWSMISQMMPGRTQNDVKNRFNSKMHRDAVASARKRKKEAVVQADVGSVSTFDRRWTQKEDDQVDTPVANVDIHGNASAAGEAWACARAGAQPRKSAHSADRARSDSGRAGSVQAGRGRGGWCSPASCLAAPSPHAIAHKPSKGTTSKVSAKMNLSSVMASAVSRSGRDNGRETSGEGVGERAPRTTQRRSMPVA